MKKKVLIGIVLIVLIIACVNWYWYTLQVVRKNVLTQLAEKLEFCEIVKDDINAFSGTGKFWLICNNRPFYAVYENGNVSYELNGWGFLKEDSNLWNELNNCDFYDSKDSQLVFYCPKDFSSSKITAKVYSFDINSLKLVKKEEKDFLEVVGADIASIYNFLSACKIENFTSTKSPEYPAILWLTFKCNKDYYIVATDLATVPIQPPILLGNLPYEERAKTSFEKSFGFSIEGIKKELNNQIIIDSSQFGIRYIFFDPTPSIYYNLKEVYNEKDVQARIKDFGKYFIFPPIGKTENIEFLGEPYQNVATYKINNKYIISVSWMKTINAINAFWRKTEGVYR